VGLHDGPPEWEAKLDRYDTLAHIGLGLVLVGTVLEAVPPFCTAIGSRKRRPVGTGRWRQSTPDPVRPMRSAFWPFRRGTPYHNDQVKLCATFFNNVAVAAFAGAIVLPLFQNKIPTWAVLVGGLIITVEFLYFAQQILSDME